MKLIYIANARIPTEKAHGIQIMKMCEAFSLAGHEVELIVSGRFTNIRENPFSYYKIKEVFKIEKLFSPGFVSLGFFGFLIQNILFLISLCSKLIFKDYDVLYLRDEISVFLLSLFSRKVTWEIHVKKNNFITKISLFCANKIVFISNGLKKYYLEKFDLDEKKTIVLHDGVDLSDYDLLKSKEELRRELNLPFDKKIISYVGKMKTMGESKGVEDIINSFPVIIKENKEAFLLLVGFNKEEIFEAENFFINLKIPQSAYRIVPHIQRTEVPKYLKSSDALVMNYPDTEHYALYMSPLKLFEYMASRVPIVSTDLPSIREVLDDKCAVFVKPGNAKSLAEGIKNVLEDKELADKIIERAFERVQNYTWQKRTENIINFIKNK